MVKLPSTVCQSLHKRTRHFVLPLLLSLACIDLMTAKNGVQNVRSQIFTVFGDHMETFKSFLVYNVRITHLNCEVLCDYVI